MADERAFDERNTRQIENLLREVSRLSVDALAVLRRIESLLAAINQEGTEERLPLPDFVGSAGVPRVMLEDAVSGLKMLHAAAGSDIETPLTRLTNHFGVR